ncbi:MAG: SDR family oxidoreductase [Defluviitaleaceae bacterium]|nr:SDR family oxidoreductase [Defluviitaleaceae bacterium]
MSILQTFSLEGKTALITGGNSGIGFGIGRAFGQAGARVAFVCSKQASLERGYENYERAGVDAKGWLCDVSDEDRVAEVVAEVERELGPVGILVNNAGIVKRMPSLEMSAADFRHIVDINLSGQFIVTKAVIPSMQKLGGGKVINIGSIMSEIGRANVAAYNAAKGGVKILTSSLADEYGEYNIQVNAIGPGFIITDMTKALRTPQPDGTPHPMKAFVEKRTPAARWGTPADIAGPALFLASSASNYVNGHMLYVDGGLVATFGKI